MDLLQLKELDDKYILNSYKRYPLQLVKGEGVYVYDENGKKYLDFLSGIAVNALGYGHPRVLKAIKDQLEFLIHTSNLFYTELPVRLACKLSEISGMNKVFFCNSGAEANELAIKLSRLNAKSFSEDKNVLICMKNSFHGRTMATLSVTKSNNYAQKFLPLIETPAFVELNNKDQLAQAVNDKTACIIIETVQGEGGINVAEKEYLQLARTLADKHNALLVIDDVQAGLGRTGDYFSFEFSGIKPDVITLAKPLGAGLPMGAVLMTEKVASLVKYGDHGSTFGANCIVAASAIAFLDVIEEENLLDNIKIVSAYLFEQLNTLKERYSFIKEVRGRGFILGIELANLAGKLHLKLMQEGLVCNCTAERVIRFLPPYITTKKHVDEAIFIMDKVFSEIKT